MGLTIHYTVEFEGTKEELVKKLETFRNFCLDLPFTEVSEVSSIDITQKHIEVFNRLRSQFAYPNNSLQNLAKRDAVMSKMGVTTLQMLEAEDWVTEKTETGRKTYRSELKPATLISFKLWAGEGCETTEFNFKLKDNKWICRSFTKTQYATEFVKCHLLVIRALEYLKDNGFQVNVSDEGGYWETKDLKVLAKNLNEYTSALLSISEQMKEICKKS